MSEDIMAKALDIQKLVEYQDDTVVSREVIKKDLGTVTVRPKLQFQVLKILSRQVKLLSCLPMNLMHFRQLTVLIK